MKNKEKGMKEVRVHVITDSKMNVKRILGAGEISVIISMGDILLHNECIA
jgi:hypothetical protein